jgi:hypothetical protein
MKQRTQFLQLQQMGVPASHAPLNFGNQDFIDKKIHLENRRVFQTPALA